MNIDEMKDRIARAEEIQRYTENRCEALEKEKCELLGIIQGKDTAIQNLQKENRNLKILISSILYEINALWNIDEMNEDIRKHAERIDWELENE